MKKILITPSILSADLGHLQEEITSLEQAGADGIQVDVMDGHFVPNLTFGAPVLQCIRTKLPLDIHLMVQNPAERIREFLEAGALHITFHAEAVENLRAQQELVAAIKKGGATAGVAVNPETSVDGISPILPSLDLVLVMSVHPGFVGQKFLPETLEKVRALRKSHRGLMIQMDGGIDATTASKCIAAGATNLVSASYIFKAKDRARAIATLRGS